MKIVQKKVCLLGDFAVGKTSLIRRFVEGRFDDHYLSSIGVKISRKSIETPQCLLNMLIWDLAGGDDLSDARSGYLRGAAGGILVCDLTRADSLNALERYVKQLRTINQDVKMLLLANKVDLVNTRLISEQTLANFAADHQVQYLLTSAKTGENVEHGFSVLASSFTSEL